jgi:hypothetical protein
VARLWHERLRNRGAIAGRVERRACSANCKERLWSQPAYCLVGIADSIRGYSEDDYSHHVVYRLRMSEAVSPRDHMPSHLYMDKCNRGPNAKGRCWSCSWNQGKSRKPGRTSFNQTVIQEIT